MFVGSEADTVSRNSGRGGEVGWSDADLSVASEGSNPAVVPVEQRVQNGRSQIPDPHLMNNNADTQQSVKIESCSGDDSPSICVAKALTIEVHGDPNRDNPSEEGQNENEKPFIPLEESFFMELRMVYYSGFRPELLGKPFQPRAPFVAADRWNMATSDTNWYGWWSQRKYYFMDTVRLAWKEEGKWVGKSVSLFKRQGLASFQFQAGTDVILAETESEATQNWFHLMRRFTKTNQVMEIDVARQRMSLDGTNFVDIVTAREKKGSVPPQFKPSRVCDKEPD